MEHNDERKSPLKVNEGVAQPEQVNPEAVERLRSLRQYMLPAEEYVQGILKGDVVLLSKAITLVESSLPGHQEVARSIISACLPHAGKAIRLGITGVPGAGKSTFIEALGMYLTGLGQRVAVLAIDPSSQRSRGSILGDKTRMEQLATHPLAYIRPSASAGTLGGVARKTRETMILCEAAGFDTLIVETVGVGQSETAVHSMVDFFLLLMIGGAGDELQGIKRGIMEMADGIVINKADGDNIARANRAKAECENALHLFPSAESGFNPRVTTCSALTGFNIEGVWQLVDEYMQLTGENGFLELKRSRQAVQALYYTIETELKEQFFGRPEISRHLPLLEQQIINGHITAYEAARELLDMPDISQQEQ